MTDNKSDDVDSVDDVDDFEVIQEFTRTTALVASRLIADNKLTPDQAIRAMAASLWATVCSYSDSKHFKCNSEYAVSVFSDCQEAASAAFVELEFDEKHQNSNWGNA